MYICTYIHIHTHIPGLLLHLLGLLALLPGGRRMRKMISNNNNNNNNISNNRNNNNNIDKNGSLVKTPAQGIWKAPFASLPPTSFLESPQAGYRDRHRLNGYLA